MQRVVAVGHFCGGTVPFGYRKEDVSTGDRFGADGKPALKRLVPNDVTAPFVRRACELSHETRCATDVRVYLKGATDQTWGHDRAKRFLTNLRGLVHCPAPVRCCGCVAAHKKRTLGHPGRCVNAHSLHRAVVDGVRGEERPRRGRLCRIRGNCDSSGAGASARKSGSLSPLLPLEDVEAMTPGMNFSMVSLLSKLEACRLPAPSKAEPAGPFRPTLLKREARPPGVNCSYPKATRSQEFRHASR